LEGWTLGSGYKPNVGKWHIYDPITGIQKLMDVEKAKTFIDMGWIRGVLSSSQKLVINRDGSKKSINQDELQSHLADGWAFGSSKCYVIGSNWMHDPITNRSRMVTGEEQKRLLESGWQMGRTTPKLEPVRITGVKGSIWMHDPITGKRNRIMPEFVQAQLDLGWLPGKG
jgi:hypothetical protein